MATIEKRKSGDGFVYRARVRIKGTKTISATFPNKTLAKDWAKKMEVDIKENKYLPSMISQKHTLKELIERYKDHIRISGLHSSSTTLAQLDVWNELLGDYTLANITPELIYTTIKDIETILTPGGQIKSAGTLNRYLAVFSAALSFGVKELGWTNSNPVFNVSRRPEPKGRVRCLSDSERNNLMEQIKKSSNPMLYPIVIIAISTGARRGEILNLKWSDVDLNRGWAVIQETKNGERRGLPLRGLALELLRDWYNKRLSDIWVFPNETNSGGINIRKSWEKAKNAAKLIDFRFHDLRHTCASYLIMNGASLGEIADALGHKTLQMVQRYAHIADSHKGGVIENMNNKIFGEKHA